MYSTSVWFNFTLQEKKMLANLSQICDALSQVMVKDHQCKKKLIADITMLW